MDPIGRVLLQNIDPDVFGDKLWLLEGSPLLQEYEPSICEALQRYEHQRNFRAYGIFAYIMTQLAELHELDAILVDVSPSNSAINQVSLRRGFGSKLWTHRWVVCFARTLSQIAAISCNYMLPPCSASLYSCGSLYGLLTSVLTGEPHRVSRCAFPPGTTTSGACTTKSSAYEQVRTVG